VWDVSTPAVTVTYEITIIVHKNVTLLINSRNIRWAGHVAHMGERRCACRFLMVEPHGKRTLERPRHRWRVILK
jgi:hypothetical protein